MNTDPATSMLLGALLCVVMTAAFARHERRRLGRAEARLSAMRDALAAGRGDGRANRGHLEGAIANGEAQWRSLTEALPLLGWTATPERTVDYLSAQACAYTRLSQQELPGDGWANAVHPDDLEETGRSWLAAVAGRTPHAGFPPRRRKQRRA